MSDTGSIEALLEQYRQGFAQLDADRLEELWDPTQPDLLYIAQELHEPVRGWDEIRRYYGRVTTILQQARSMTLRDVDVQIYGDIALAYGVFRFEGEVDGHSHVAEGLTTFVLRNTPAGWRVIRYQETGRPAEPTTSGG
jgi:ketosteroid isomerase-like protein